jgi:hypothetical protein
MPTPKFRSAGQNRRSSFNKRPAALRSGNECPGEHWIDGEAHRASHDGTREHAE